MADLWKAGTAILEKNVLLATNSKGNIHPLAFTKPNSPGQQLTWTSGYRILKISLVNLALTSFIRRLVVTVMAKGK